MPIKRLNFKLWTRGTHDTSDLSTFKHQQKDLQRTTLKSEEKNYYFFQREKMVLFCAKDVGFMKKSF